MEEFSASTKVSAGNSSGWAKTAKEETIILDMPVESRARKTTNEYEACYLCASLL
jgi:hypothetical protein